MKTHRISFNRPAIVGRELEYVDDCFRRMQISGGGHYTELCERWFEQRYGVHRCLLTTSCTHAMEMAGLLYGLEPDDEFILPSFTFSSTATAFCLRGARPRFVDVDPHTLNLDPEAVVDAITDRTRVIVAVHYAGIGADMHRLREIAEEHGLHLMEDAAQAIESRWRGRALGSFGSLGALSFHETKNVTCGEGGALFVNDPALVERAEIIREKGTNRSRFQRGEVDKYTWLDHGSSYVPSEILAAFLLGQLEAIDTIQERRRELWKRYHAGFAELEERGLLTRPAVPEGAEPNQHLYYVLLESEGARRELAEELARHGILAVSHYVPLHLAPMGRKLGGPVGPLPVTESIAPRLLRMPMYLGLDDEAQQEVIRHVVQHLTG